MAQDRVSKTILQYTVDQASVNKAIQSADRVEGRIKALATTSDKVTSRTGSTLGKIETVTQQLSRSLSGLGLGGAGQALGGISDIFQIKNATADAAEGSKLLSTGLIGLTAVTAATAGAIQLMNQNLTPTAQLLTQATSQLDAYYEAIATGTSESIQKQLETLRAQKQSVETEAAQMQAAFDKAFQSEQKGFGGDAVARLKFALAETNPEFKKTEERLAALKAQSLDLTGKIGGLETALGSSSVAANDAAEAEKKLAAVRDQIIEKGIARDIEQSKLLRSATPDQVKDLVASREDEIRAIRERMGEVDKESEKYKELETRLKDAQQWLDFYNDTLTDAANANKAAADAEKRRADAERARQDYLTKQPEAIADAVRKYNADVKAIEDKGLADRAAIQQRYNDAMVEAARRTAEGAEDALRKLGQQREDINTGLGRDLEKFDREAAVKELDIKIAAQRDEAKAYREHYNELAKIRQDAADREADMILNRDFLALFQSRRQTTVDLRNANTQFGQQQSEQQIADQNSLNDLRRSVATQRQERLIAYNQQLQDAQTAYNRELQQQQIAEQRAIDLANAARIADLNAQRQAERTALDQRRQQAISEINYAGMTYDARIKYLQAETDYLIQKANGLAGRTVYQTAASSAEQRAFVRPGGIVRTAADGAMLGAGDLSVVHGGEAFSGLGLLYALQGGAVTNNINSQFSISGNNPEAIWRYIEPKIAQTVLRLIS